MRKNVTGGGVWRIRRQQKSKFIEVFRIADKGHGGILSEEFLRWREQLQAREIVNMLG